MKDKEIKLIKLLKGVKKLGVNLEKVFEEQILNKKTTEKEDSQFFQGEFFEENKIFNAYNKSCEQKLEVCKAPLEQQ